MSFFSILPIIGISWWFRNKFKTLQDFDLLFSISLSVSFFYFFGLINLINLGYYIIFFIGIFLFIIFILKEKNIFYFKRYFYFILLCSFCFIFSKFTQFNLWDEFFWAQYTKSIFYEKKIYDAFSILQNHPRYTPGLPIYQNYFNFIFKKFNDDSLIFANLILILSYCFIFFGKSSLDQKIIFIKKNIIIFLPILILFYIFSFGYLYVEFYISIFLSAIIIFINLNNIKINNLIIILPLLIFFLLIKETTIIFIPLVLFYIILLNYKNTNVIYFLIILILACILIKTSWYYYVFTGGSNQSSDDLLISSLKEFYSTFLIMLPTYINTFQSVILDYGHFTSITRKLGLPDFTTIVWILLSLFLLAINSGSILKEKRKIKIFISIYLFGIFYYLFTFFIDFAFWGGAPVHFNRLSSSIIVTILLINFFTFYNLGFIDKYFKTIIVLLFIVLSFVTINLTFIRDNFKNYLSKQEILNNKIFEIRKNAHKINDITDGKSKIFFIHQKSSGFERTVFNYFVHPNEVNSNSWSIGEPYDKIDNDFEDIWSSNLSYEQLINKLNNDLPYKNKYRKCCENVQIKKYDYIFINNGDEKLWSKISFLFLNKSDYLNNKFFKILFENKIPKLKPIF